MVEVLLIHGAEVNVQDNGGDTPLHDAARRGQKDIVELLLAKGADTNARDNSGRTPADEAVRRGHEEIVKLLQKHAAKE
jgi:ankyrin repeat protein